MSDFVLKFDKPGLMQWDVPFAVPDDETVFRLKLTIKKIGSVAPIVSCGFICLDDGAVNNGDHPDAFARSLLDEMSIVHDGFDTYQVDVPVGSAVDQIRPGTDTAYLSFMVHNESEGQVTFLSAQDITEPFKLGGRIDDQVAITDNLVSRLNSITYTYADGSTSVITLEEASAENARRINQVSYTDANGTSQTLTLELVTSAIALRLNEVLYINADTTTTTRTLEEATAENARRMNEVSYAGPDGVSSATSIEDATAGFVQRFNNISYENADASTTVLTLEEANAENARRLNQVQYENESGVATTSSIEDAFAEQALRLNSVIYTNENSVTQTVTFEQATILMAQRLNTVSYVDENNTNQTTTLEQATAALAQRLNTVSYQNASGTFQSVTLEQATALLAQRLNSVSYVDENGSNITVSLEEATQRNATRSSTTESTLNTPGTGIVARVDVAEQTVADLDADSQAVWGIRTSVLANGLRAIADLSLRTAIIGQRVISNIVLTADKIVLTSGAAMFQLLSDRALFNVPIGIVINGHAFYLRPNSSLIWWFGVDGIALSSMSGANCILALETTGTVRYGGQELVNGGGGAKLTQAISDTIATALHQTPITTGFLSTGGSQVLTVQIKRQMSRSYVVPESAGAPPQGSFSMGQHQIAIARSLDGGSMLNVTSFPFTPYGNRIWFRATTDGQGNLVYGDGTSGDYYVNESASIDFEQSVTVGGANQQFAQFQGSLTVDPWGTVGVSSQNLKITGLEN